MQWIAAKFYHTSDAETENQSTCHLSRALDHAIQNKNFNYIKNYNRQWNDEFMHSRWKQKYTVHNGLETICTYQIKAWKSQTQVMLSCCMTLTFCAL